MTILVTGGAGYVGSHTVKLLVARNIDVVVIDDLSTGTTAPPPTVPLHRGDIRDHLFLNEVFNTYDIDSVIHFAGKKNVGESMKHPEKYWSTNVQGTALLLETMSRFQVRKVVFSSSCSVYGSPVSLPVRESNPVNPESVYAETKLVCERMLHWYDVTSAIKSVSLRYFNAAGAALDGTIGEDWSHTANLIPVVMKALLGTGDSLQVFGTDFDTPDGSGVRDYVHVDDLAEAHLAAVEALQDSQRSITVNLGTGRGSSVREIIAAAEEISGKKVPHTLGPRREGDPAAVFADTALALEELSWKAKYDLRTIISTAYLWHSQNLRA